MSDHNWCRDTARDEAVRAAEDASAVPAIQHRDLPEQVALLWASLGDLIGRVVRLEGEMDAGQDEEASPAEGMRKEHGESVRVVEEPAEIALLTDERDLARAVRDGLRSQRDAARARVAELEAAAPPRGWLTAQEREAVEEAMVDYASNVGDHDCERIERVLRALLARETPPRVKVPQVNAAWVDFLHERDGKWRDAIRAAGGEVEG